jgi:shikimate kinase
MFSDKRKNLFLIGFMGAGKTTVGKLLADNLAWCFIDLDQVIEQHSGRTIPEIFADQGESVFRDMESQALAEVSTKAHAVVATGGGVVGREKNRHLMRDTGIVVFLDVPWKQLLERIGEGQGRPLAEGEDAVQRLTSLYEQRLPLYRTADLVIDCSRQSPEDLAEGIISRLNEKKLFLN